MTHEEILQLPICKYISEHPDKFKITDKFDWSGLMGILILNPVSNEWFHLCEIRQGELIYDTGRPYVEISACFFDTWDDSITHISNKSVYNGHVDTYSDTRALFAVNGLNKTWLDELTPKTLESLYTRFTGLFKNVSDYYDNLGIKFNPRLYEYYKIYAINPTADKYHQCLDETRNGAANVQRYVKSLIQKGFIDIVVYGGKNRNKTEIPLEDFGISVPNNTETQKRTESAKTHKLSIHVREAKAIPDNTLHTVLANLKCLGKPGKAMQNYPLKRRRDIFDEMVKRGWLEPNSINLTDKGEEEAKNWIHLCQESKKSESEQVSWDDDFDMTSAAHDRLYNAIMKNPKGFTGGDAGYMLAEFVKDHKDLILAKFIQDVTLDLDHALYAVDNKYEWMEACFDRAVENM